MRLRSTPPQAGQGPSLLRGEPPNIEAQVRDAHSGKARDAQVAILAARSACTSQAEHVVVSEPDLKVLAAGSTSESHPQGLVAGNPRSLLGPHQARLIVLERSAPDPGRADPPWPMEAAFKPVQRQRTEQPSVEHGVEQDKADVVKRDNEKRRWEAARLKDDLEPEINGRVRQGRKGDPERR